MRAWGSYLGEHEICDDREKAYSILDAIDDDSDDGGSDDERLFLKQRNPISLYQITTSIYNEDQCIVTVQQQNDITQHEEKDQMADDTETINSSIIYSSARPIAIDIDGENTTNTITDSELELSPIPSLNIQQSMTEPTNDIFADIEITVGDDKPLDPTLIQEINDIINSCHHSNNYGNNNYSNNNQNKTQKNNNSQKQNNNNNNNNDNSSSDSGNDGFGGSGGSGSGGSGGNGDNDKNGDDDKYKKREKHKNKNNKRKQKNNKEKNEEDEEKILNINAEEFIPNKLVNKLEPIDEKRPLQSSITNSKKPMKQSIRSNYSYDPIPILRAKGNIKISREFTDKNGKTSQMIKEDIKNLYFYLDKCMALQTNKAINLKNGKTIKIINLDFHHKNTNENLYCVLEKCDSQTGFKWEMYNELLTQIQIEQKYKVSMNKYPQSRMNEKFQKQLNQKQDIINIMMNKQKMEQVIKNTKWAKIPIKNRYHTKKRMTLSMTQKEFIKNLHVHNMNVYTCPNEINLIPILMFNNVNDTCNKCWVEYLWITKIDKDINIAISLKYNTKTNNISVRGIHLDKTYILHQTQLTLPSHSADFLDDIFFSNISDLSIGNPDDDKNAIKALKQRCEVLKQEKLELKTKCDDLNQQNIDLTKQMEEIRNECENMKQFMLSTSIPNVPSISSSNTTPTSISVETMHPSSNGLSFSTPMINLQNSTSVDPTSYQSIQPQLLNNGNNELTGIFYSIGHNFIFLNNQMNQSYRSNQAILESTKSYQSNNIPNKTGTNYFLPNQTNVSGYNLSNIKMNDTTIEHENKQEKNNEKE